MKVKKAVNLGNKQLESTDLVLRKGEIIFAAVETTTSTNWSRVKAILISLTRTARAFEFSIPSRLTCCWCWAWCSTFDIWNKVNQIRRNSAIMMMENIFYIIINAYKKSCLFRSKDIVEFKCWKDLIRSSKNLDDSLKSN